MFTFVNATSNLFPNLQYRAWKAFATNRDDYANFMRSTLATRFGRDPHLFNEGAPKSFMAALLEPSLLLDAALRRFDTELKRRSFALVNQAGAILPADLEVRHEFQSRGLTWKPEPLIIYKWQGGTHYYVKGKSGNIVFPDKFNDFESAYTASLSVVDAPLVSTVEVKLPQDGD